MSYQPEARLRAAG